MKQRLIDANKAKNKLSGFTRYTGIDEAPYEYAETVIDKLPTVDAEPVKHGKWIDDKGMYKCSVCNNLWAHWWIAACSEGWMDKEMKFCPNCGAKMDGERRENGRFEKSHNKNACD